MHLYIQVFKCVDIKGRWKEYFQDLYIPKYKIPEFIKEQIFTCIALVKYFTAKYFTVVNCS